MPFSLPPAFLQHAGKEVASPDEEQKPSQNYLRVEGVKIKDIGKVRLAPANSDHKGYWLFYCGPRALLKC